MILGERFAPPRPGRRPRRRGRRGRVLRPASSRQKSIDTSVDGLRHREHVSVCGREELGETPPALVEERVAGLHRRCVGGPTPRRRSAVAPWRMPPEQVERRRRGGNGGRRRHALAARRRSPRRPHPSDEAAAAPYRRSENTSPHSRKSEETVERHRPPCKQGRDGRPTRARRSSGYVQRARAQIANRCDLDRREAVLTRKVQHIGRTTSRGAAETVWRAPEASASRCSKEARLGAQRRRRRLRTL